MHPIITQIGPLYIYSYGLMVAIGFSVATILAYKHSGEFGLDKDRIIDFGIASLLGGVIGARALYVATNLNYYIANPIEVFNLTKGGLVWYGALVFGLIIAAVFVRVHKINFWDGADLYAPFIALAQSFGRIGCFLNGCCYGSASPKDYILSVIFPGEAIARHPTQIYSSLILLFIYVVLRKRQKSRLFRGEIFLEYLMFYSVTRFGLEFIRGDNPKILYVFTMSQLISVAILSLSLIIFLVRLNRWKRSSKSA